MRNYKKADFWSEKARKEGYPARSVYKLQEMDDKFKLLPKGSAPARVLDLGAAPGSWSLYVLRHIAGRTGAGLVSCDLSPLSTEFGKEYFTLPCFSFIQGDFTSAEIRERILGAGPYSLLLSDAAPATTGNRGVDTARSEALSEDVFSYAETALDKGGSLVIKFFQGSATNELLKRMKSLFTKAQTYKPEACRNESFETYLVGLCRK
jgi:23S rRNA (uridine2552-2'-O)-methyltransferase